MTVSAVIFITDLIGKRHVEKHEPDVFQLVSFDQDDRI